MHPDDELLSALLDGEDLSGDAAHVDECAQCQERVATLGRVSSLVGTPVGLPAAHLREASLAIAMDTKAAKPVPAGPLRPRNALSAAAALLVALAVGGLLISQMGQSGGGGATAAQRDAAADAVAGGGAASSDGLSNESALRAHDDAAGPYLAGDIGAFDSIHAVFERSTADRSNGDPSAYTMQGEAPSCPIEIAGRTVWQATLTFNGEAAVAYLVETETGLVMQILRRTDCAVLGSQEFAPTTPR